MANLNTWTVTDSNGASHTIERKTGFGGNKIIIDGAVYKTKSSNWFINLIDYQIQFPGLNCNLVVIGNKADLSVNGTYLGSGKSYEPVGSIPAWIWVLVAVSAIGGWFFGGILCMAIGIGLSTVYVQGYLEKKMNKVWIAFGAFVVIAIIFLLLNLFLLAV